jgi:hypothetical protein
MPATDPLVWVLDTNWVLDVWVFTEPAAHALRQRLGLPCWVVANAGAYWQAPTHALQPLAHERWMATQYMRDELERVLHYPYIAQRREQLGLPASEVLRMWDAHTTLCPSPPKSPYTCTDADDQIFIDLAVQHQAVLLSKDRAVLRMKKRLLRLGATVQSTWTEKDPPP